VKDTNGVVSILEDLPGKFSFSDEDFADVDHTKGFAIKLSASDQIIIYDNDDYSGASETIGGADDMDFFSMTSRYGAKTPSIRWGRSPVLPLENVKATLFLSSDCSF